MMFKGPVSLNRALESQVAKVLMPTHLRSNMLATLPVEVRRRSMFIAAEANADVLQEVDNAIKDVLSGQHTEETARSLMQRLPDMLDNPRLQREGRARLILETNIDLARGYGGYQQSQNMDVLEEWPAWEFYRAEERKEHRDWPERWAALGGRFYPGASDYPEGRMIARKDDPIWERLSAFDLPYAPFDWNSGMDVRDIDRDEAEELGVISAEEQVMPERMAFNTDVEASPSAAGSILDALVDWYVGQGIGRLVGGGVVRLMGGGN